MNQATSTTFHQPSASAAGGTTSQPEIDPRHARDLLASGSCVIVDVREPDEFARERIPGATLMPLSTCTPAKVEALRSRHVVMYCKGGVRAGDAQSRCATLAHHGIEVQSVRGGIEGWKAAGLATVVDSTRQRLSVMQQTQLTIGFFVLSGTVLGALVDPWFLILPTIMGAGLTVAGATGFCGLAVVMGKMPWNKTKACTTGSCCR